MQVAAILVAAGRGTRMGSEVPKAFLPLQGQPMFLHALRTLRQVAEVSEVVVVTSADQEERAARVLAREPGETPVRLVRGGAERQDSVAAGLAAVPQADFVVVHDAARPLVSRECVAACIASGFEHGASIAAVPCHDTVKEVGEDGIVRRTLPRQYLWLAQTPQVCRAGWLRSAFERARAENWSVTDEAMLLERCGYAVRVVAADPSNRKVTTAEDLAWAEWFLSRRAPERG